MSASPRRTLDVAIFAAAEQRTELQQICADALFEMGVLDAALSDLQKRRDDLWWKVYHPTTNRLDANRRWIECLADADPTGTKSDDELAQVPVIANLMAHQASLEVPF